MLASFVGLVRTPHDGIHERKMRRNYNALSGSGTGGASEGVVTFLHGAQSIEAATGAALVSIDRHGGNEGGSG
jgi:hypothetical protein